MRNPINKLFGDKTIVTKIQKKLPFLFQLAEMESQRAGKVGMEVGSLREKILISLFLYKFGKNNINAEVPITAPEVDFFLFDKPISIKTKSNKSFSGVKLIWTVDYKKVEEFQINYNPSCAILFTQIVWNGTGGFCYIFPETQKTILKKIGRDNYIKKPPQGTNPRGVEISSQALELLVNHKQTLKIDIEWKKANIDFNPYEKWVEYWQED